MNVNLDEIAYKLRQYAMESLGNGESQNRVALHENAVHKKERERDREL